MLRSERDIAAILIIGVIVGLVSAVEDRNTFVLNIKVEDIDPSKSTWAEVQLILQPGNGYRLVEGGDSGYDMLVPIESLAP